MVSCFSYYILMKKTIALCICSVLICILAFGICLKKINREGFTVKSEEYQTILELWNIDTFEGGTGSRKDFLLKTGAKYEKKHKGVIVSVINYTPLGAKQALKTKVPDMVSCGAGMDFFIPYLNSISFSSNYKTVNLGKKSYGIAWCYGVYVLIGGGNKNLAVGQGEYNNPLKHYDIKGYESVKTYSPYSAYSEFLKGKCDLLGTQRDLYRLSNKGVEFEYKVLDEYSDLAQNMLITTQNKKNFTYCESFLSYMLTEEVQSRLGEIGLLPVKKTGIYKDGVLERAEKVEIKKFSSFFDYKQKQ